jgi:hypothetical protein
MIFFDNFRPPFERARLSPPRDSSPLLDLSPSIRDTGQPPPHASRCAPPPTLSYSAGQCLLPTRHAVDGFFVLFIVFFLVFFPFYFFFFLRASLPSPPPHPFVSLLAFRLPSLYPAFSPTPLYHVGFLRRLPDALRPTPPYVRTAASPPIARVASSPLSASYTLLSPHTLHFVPSRLDPSRSITRPPLSRFLSSFFFLFFGSPLLRTRPLPPHLSPPPHFLPLATPLIFSPIPNHTPSHMPGGAYFSLDYSRAPVFAKSPSQPSF